MPIDAKQEAVTVRDALPVPINRKTRLKIGPSNYVSLSSSVSFSLLRAIIFDYANTE